MRRRLREGLLEERHVGKEQGPVQTESGLSGMALHHRDGNGCGHSELPNLAKRRGRIGRKVGSLSMQLN